MCCLLFMPLLFMAVPLMLIPVLENIFDLLPLILAIAIIYKVIKTCTSPEEKKKMMEMRDKCLQQFNLRECPCKSTHNIVETNNAFFVDIELPGVKKEDIAVETEGSVITINCPRYRQDYETEETVKICDYKRRVVLPESANMDSVIAKYENGILSVFVEKKPEFATQKKNIVIE